MIKPILKESTVKYKDGYYRVSAVYQTTANLSHLFSSKVLFKGIRLNELVEAHDEWYAKWSQSETYQSM